MEKIDLCKINPRHYDDRFLRPGEILPWFENEDAVWLYEGEPSPDKPHAELTSGLCSNGFIDCLAVLRYPNIAEILAKQLFWRLTMGDWAKPDKVDWVVSSSYAAITFGHEVAKAFNVIFMMTEKDEANPKKQTWRRMTIPAGARVLQIEELITTSGIFQEVHRAVEEGNAVKPVSFLPIVGTLVHRPPKLPAEYDGRKVIAVIEREIQVFKPGPEECPYCKVGSPRYRPKTHWQELTGKG